MHSLRIPVIFINNKNFENKIKILNDNGFNTYCFKEDNHFRISTSTDNTEEYNKLMNIISELEISFISSIEIFNNHYNIILEM